MSTKITRRTFVQGAAALVPLALRPTTLRQSTTQAGGDRFDVVVAGAGHNSLTTACYLAKAGYRVLVLEGRPVIGGGTKTAQLTLRGFNHDVCSWSHAYGNNPPMKELKLADYGLEYFYPDPVKHSVFGDNSYITEWKDFDRTCQEIAKYSKKDAETYRRMADEAEPIRRILAAANKYDNYPIGFAPKTLPAPSIPNMWKRRLAMSKWEVLRQNFEDERTITFMLAPHATNIMQPNGGLGGYPSKTASAALAKGGSGMLAVALGRCLEAHGGVILVNKPVVQLIVEGGKCIGVECADGSTYKAAKAVLSTLHIKRLVQLAKPDLWGEEFLEGVRTFITGGGSCNVHLATSEPMKFPVEGGTLEAVRSTSLTGVKRAIMADTELALREYTFQLAEPACHIVQASVGDPTRAPAGMHTIRMLSDGAVYNLKDGGPERWEEIKEQFGDAHVKIIQRMAPNLTDDKILARFVISPVDTERMNPAMWEGSCHGGTDAPCQAGELRPVPGWAQHRMPIPGLYQTGGTTHPGGGVNGWPGRNAAMVMLKDFGSSLEQAINGEGT